MNCDQAKALAVRLAPELAGKLEVIRHRPEWPAPPGAAAYAMRGRHLGIRDELRRLERWQGVWPSTIVFMEEPSAAVLIHELAHVLPAKPPIEDDGDEVPELARDLQTLQLRQWATSTATDELPWKGHDARWIRRTLHLWHRAERLGVDVRPLDIRAAGEAYGLQNDIVAYQAALNVEPYAFFSRTFAEIDTAPLPEMFINRFVRDAAEWFRHQLTQEQTS